MWQKLVSSSNLIVKDMTAGVISGCLATFVGFPLDTIKVRMQVSNSPKTVYQCTKEILATDGFRGLYKGVLSPLMGRAPGQATVLATNSYTKRMMKDWNLHEDTKLLLSG